MSASIRRAAALGSAAIAMLVGRAPEVLAQGCAMCQASLPGAEDPLAWGFNYSMFMFLGVTYGVVGAVGGWIGYKYWRASRPRHSTRVLSFQPAQGGRSPQPK